MIGRPFRCYSMSLVERLGFQTLDNLYLSMSSDAIMEWMAYDMLKNPELRERLEQELQKEKIMTPEQTSNAIVQLFASLGK